MPKHWTENLPDTYQGEQAEQIRILGRSIKADHVRIKSIFRDILSISERITRSEKLIDTLIGDIFTEDELESLYASDQMPTCLPAGDCCHVDPFYIEEKGGDQ